MTSLAKIGVLVGVATLSVSACNRSSDRAASEPVQTADNRDVRDRDAYDDDARERGEMGDRDGEGVLQPASRAAPAAQAIAEARCARERRCENVGTDEKYSSMSDCMADIRSDWKDDLNARECPGGVNQTELQECLTAIRNEECNSPFDTLDRVTECTATAICVEDKSDQH